MTLNKLRFILLRLQRSSTPELFHRLQEFLFVYFFRGFSFILRRSCSALQLSLYPRKTIFLPKLHGNIDAELQQMIREGHCYCLHETEERVIAYEKDTCSISFSNVPLLPDGPDIRAVWEKGRLQHLSLILQAIEQADNKAEKTQDIDFIRTELLQWLKENPFGYGPHYISVMECGLRTPLFLRALLVVDSWKPEETQRLVQAIYQHGWLIRKRLSLYSSLGNHTVTECVGLVFAGCIFRETKEGAEWLKKGVELLEQECYHQILPDGGPIEQSFTYHRFVLDLYWLAIDFLEKNGLHNCVEMEQRVVLSEAFLAVMQKAHEPALRIGDSDDGLAVGPELYPAIRDDVTNIVDDHPVTTFSDSGYTVMRTDKGARMVIDHGPLGMAPLYNHGHADALSVLLSIGDVDFLVDPGTYQYNGDLRLRRYFKGTGAHNTVTIDGCDQAEQLTSFVWGKPYTVEWSRERNNGNQECLVARHNGYCRLSPPITHVRKLLWLSDETFVLEDSFEGSGTHSYELNFHLHPDVVVDRTPKGFLLQSGGQTLGIAIADEQLTVVQGAEDPLCGWYSPSYGVVEKTNTLHLKKEGNAADVRFRTLLHIGGGVSYKLIESVSQTCDILS